MRLWTSAALGAAAVVACASSASAQVAGCASCGGKPLAGAVPNTIPHCSKHTGLTQYPLSEKRYIKQFCNPTIAPGSCFGHFKTCWTPWPQACPGWPTDGVAPANFGPNFIPFAQPDLAQQPAVPPQTAPTAPPQAPAVEAPAAPPSKPLDLPPSKPLTPAVPNTTPPPTPASPPAVKLPDLPASGAPRF